MADILELIQPLLPTLVEYGVRVVGVLVVLWIALRVAGRVQRTITTRLRRREFDETLSIFFGAIARWLIIIGTVLGCLGAFGVETTSFAAVIGAAGLAVGLAFQGTLSNFAAGVMLLVFRPFSVGDVITAAGHTGAVKEIGLFVCVLDTPDNRRIVVPNSAINSGSIENVTHHPTRRVDIAVGTDYGADLDATRAALEGACAVIPGRHAELGHQIVLSELGGSSVDWAVRVWCKTEDYWDVREATIKAVKEALDAAKIEIPYPHVDVNVRSQATVRL